VRLIVPAVGLLDSEDEGTITLYKTGNSHPVAQHCIPPIIFSNTDMVIPDLTLWTKLVKLMSLETLPTTTIFL
jgi:hypothetical protein